MSKNKRKKKTTKDIDQAVFYLEGNTLFLRNTLDFNNSGKFVIEVLKKTKKQKSKALVIDLKGLKDIDSAGVTAVNYIREKLSDKGVNVRIDNASDSVNKKFELFRMHKPVADAKQVAPSFLELIGTAVYSFFNDYIVKFLYLTADVFFWSIHDLFKTKARRKGEVINQAVAIGVNATIIVVVMTFIVGLVLALQSSAQLRHFGANIFIVDLTVIAMMAQMGPLITAILVAGRSGSAIAAEIATMKVTAELDALKTMGLNPVRFVVVPKIYGCLSTIPFLTILANVAGITGGMVAANIFLDITPEIFINRMEQSLYNKDIVTSIIKSLVYGSIIVLTGSFFGFRVKEGAEGVGKTTTIAVVVSISLVIIADSILGLIFYT